MFDDFDSLDMYGFLSYLEESSQVDSEFTDLQQQYGVYEEDNYIYVEDSVLTEIMETYNLTKEEASHSILESFMNELNEEKKDDEPVVIDMVQGRDGVYRAKNTRGRRVAGAAIGTAVVAGSAHLAHRAAKKYKAKKELEEKRRNKGFKGKIRKLGKKLHEGGNIMLEEAYGIFEEDGELFIENEMVEAVMEEYELSESEAIEAIMEAYEEELAEAGQTMEQKEKISHYYAGMNPENGSDHSAHNKRKAKVAAGVALAAGGALAARKIAKKRRAKKLREDYGIFEENGELFIENEMVEAVMESYELSEEEAIDAIMESYEEELSEAEGQLELPAPDGDEEEGKKGLSRRAKAGIGAAAALGTAAAIGGGVKVAKKRAAKKRAAAEEEARRNKGLRGKLRRLREDYGIFEENGELFIENEMVESVMESYNLTEDDAIDLIMESYEEELSEAEGQLALPAPGDEEGKKGLSRRAKAGIGAAAVTTVAGGALLARKAAKKRAAKKAAAEGKKGVKCGKKRLREDALSVAHEVSSASHHHVADDAYKLYRQAEMDEGDADRNLARGGKNILGGIKQAPRSEQDKAGKEGVRFKNRVDDGDMDGKFIDSDIQKPMGAGRRIAEDSDMGF